MKDCFSTVSFQSRAVLMAGAISLAGAAGASAQTSLDDLTYTGTGTSRAAIVIDWQAPDVFNNTTVPAPIENRVLAFGYNFTAPITGTQLLNGVLANDHRLFATTAFAGSFVVGFGYDLDNDGVFGVTDGTTTFTQADFVAGKLDNSAYDPDTFHSLDPQDLYWAGLNGPGFELWNEAGGAGGYLYEPNRGANQYWTPDDVSVPFSGNHGQWHYADLGTGGEIIANGSWQGWSVAGGGFEFGNDTAPGTVAYNFQKQAPGFVPEPTSLALFAAAGAFGVSRRRR